MIFTNHTKTTSFLLIILFNRTIYNRKISLEYSTELQLYAQLNSNCPFVQIKLRLFFSLSPRIVIVFVLQGRLWEKIAFSPIKIRRKYNKKVIGQ